MLFKSFLAIGAFLVARNVGGAPIIDCTPYGWDNSEKYELTLGIVVTSSFYTSLVNSNDQTLRTLMEDMVAAMNTYGEDAPSAAKWMNTAFEPYFNLRLKLHPTIKVATSNDLYDSCVPGPSNPSSRDDPVKVHLRNFRNNQPTDPEVDLWMLVSDWSCDKYEAVGIASMGFDNRVTKPVSFITTPQAIAGNMAKLANHELSHNLGGDHTKFSSVTARFPIAGGFPSNAFFDGKMISFLGKNDDWTGKPDTDVAMCRHIGEAISRGKLSLTKVPAPVPAPVLPTPLTCCDPQGHPNWGAMRMTTQFDCCSDGQWYPYVPSTPQKVCGVSCGSNGLPECATTLSTNKVASMQECALGEWVQGSSQESCQDACTNSNLGTFYECDDVKTANYKDQAYRVAQANGFPLQGVVPPNCVDLPPTHTFNMCFCKRNEPQKLMDVFGMTRSQFMSTTPIVANLPASLEPLFKSVSYASGEFTFKLKQGFACTSALSSLQAWASTTFGQASPTVSCANFLQIRAETLLEQLEFDTQSRRKRKDKSKRNDKKRRKGDKQGGNNGDGDTITLQFSKNNLREAFRLNCGRPGQKRCSIGLECDSSRGPLLELDSNNALQLGQDESLSNQQSLRSSIFTELLAERRKKKSRQRKKNKKVCP